MNFYYSTKGPEENATILVVDDDDAVVGLVRNLLRKEQYRVMIAKDGKQALHAAAQLAPHLIVLDLSLPRLSGMDVCSELRYWYKAPILILSGHGAEETIVEALDSGADDYLTKPVRRRELLARIRALLRRFSEQPARMAIVRAGELEVNFAQRRVLLADKEIRFTRTEFEILGCLVQNLDCVVTSKMLLDKVWGPTHGDYSQTLRVHIGHIRKKIETDDSARGYILTEPGVGYRFSVPSSQSARAQPKALAIPQPVGSHAYFLLWQPVIDQICGIPGLFA